MHGVLPPTKRFMNVYFPPLDSMPGCSETTIDRPLPSNLTHILSLYTAYLHPHSAYKNFGGTVVNGINDSQNSALAARKVDLLYYVNNLGGSLVCLGQSSLTSAYTWLPKALTQVWNFLYQ